MDEVGRGALAGPLVAAAVAWPDDLEPPAGIHLADSKSLAREQRQTAAAWIREQSICLAIESVGVPAINTLGMGWANRAIFGRLMSRMRAQRYLVDGNLHLHGLAPEGSVVICICDGDVHEPAVAAASIVAKVYRDSLMESLHDDYPCYGWSHNAGYATAEHRGALLSAGACPHHRTLFLRHLIDEGIGR